MFEAKFEADIEVKDIPVQWIPKIEIYYPDLPQFPIMYIHKNIEAGRLIAFSIAVSFNIFGQSCTATFHVLSSLNVTETIRNTIKTEIEERIGLSDKINKEVVLQCCNDSEEYKTFFSDLWQYISASYGKSIPYGRFLEEVYSIVRFVSAWQPKTGRQSEMRMLYNFMSIFGEKVEMPDEWTHLECYAIPHLEDVKNKNFAEFDKFKILDSAMRKTFEEKFTETFNVKETEFKVLTEAWKQNKSAFIENISEPLFNDGKLNENEKFAIERLVDVFNRHSWRAAFFISSYMAIDKDYYSWSKEFFKEFYAKGGNLKGYSEKVIACFLQQGFKNEDVIPIDVWIESFYKFPLGIAKKEKFYDSFSKLGKLERVIWLASQSNKTNMKTFFDLLWCQKYAMTGKSDLRGVNPIACGECKLKSTCVGLNKITDNNILLLNDTSKYNIQEVKAKKGDKKTKKGIVIVPKKSVGDISNVTFICVLENKIPKKVFKKTKQDKFYLIDEFSGFIMKEKHKLSDEMIAAGIVTMGKFTEFYKDFVADKDFVPAGNEN